MRPDTVRGAHSYSGHVRVAVIYTRTLKNCAAFDKRNYVPTYGENVKAAVAGSSNYVFYEIGVFKTVSLIAVCRKGKIVY